ncbi:PAS domain S-box-containing protein [Paenibacillus sp. V4I3]|uniref:PAS domain S-box protein n=1 Tax=Paenibacillus sp. V4I3 TaxID=3042305 RepID=UPI0027874BD3|nr:PAS domain S-box protein [Paenibacillus sp. V4I3]MDQ0874718.1 PAS domain S-box-containing protein [Paenibacillus sp. V4I3]
MPKVDFDRDSVYQQVYTFAPNAIALVSLDGTIRRVNPSFYPTLGYTEQEAIGLTLKEITHPDDLNKINALIEEVLNGNSLLYELEKRCIQKNGNLIRASVRLSLVRDEKQGTPLYFIVHIIDISDKIATEQKLLKIEELYELILENAQDIITLVNPDGKIEYLSPSVHDLLGYEPEELIGKDSSELNHPEDLEKIRSEPFSDNEVITYRSRHKNGTYIWFETAIKLIRDDQGNLLKVLGIGRDITERKKYQDNLAEAQHIAMLGSWELDILHNKITFSEEFYQIYNLFKNNLPSDPTDLAFLIHPDDRQRFHEFIDQAIQGTTISSEFRNLQLNGTIKYMQVRVSVTFDENGKPVKMNGTTQDITERKKVELKQLDSFMTRQSEGTGLGLAISKKIVGLMGGDIWFEEMDEPGATFVFTVWIKEEVSYLEDSSIQEIAFVQKPLKVLIAEDNQINQIVLKKMIEKMGHFTSIAENGNQVIRALAYETYDIIFMDVQMPVLNGLETTKQIKETIPQEKVPYIIAVTANALKGDREKCLEAGMDDYISKPIKSEVIFDRIEKHQKLKGGK